MAQEVQPTPRRFSPRASVLDRRPEYEQLGLWLRKQRESKGVQQIPLSRVLHKPPAFINKVEHGNQRIDVVEFLDLWKALDLPPDVTIGDLMSQLTRATTAQAMELDSEVADAAG